MRPAVWKYDAGREYSTEERCYINELLGQTDDPELSVARARVEPGVTTAWHALDGVVERYVILEGTGRVEVGDLEAREVGPGDLVYIPAATRQRITNTGASDLIFLCLCTPPFNAERYQSLE
jgi:mannose-6-phosphate isomerase-like protein (cupin superfamily)